MAESILDKRICDVVEHATNTQTYREFINETVNEFMLVPQDVDNMSNEDLEAYISFLDDVWGK